MANMGAMVNDPDIEQVLRRVMAEVATVGRALGAELNTSIDKRIEATRSGAAGHKTSMLQDIERGRMLEINPIVGAVAEVARLVGVETPTIDTVLALVKLRANQAGLMPG
jgi:2-dehydropantoate 2-reductase